MSYLNVKASEWQPSGTAASTRYLTDFVLPPAVADEEREDVNKMARQRDLSPKAKPFAPAWTVTSEAEATSALSTNAQPFVPGQATTSEAEATSALSTDAQPFVPGQATTSEAEATSALSTDAQPFVPGQATASEAEATSATAAPASSHPTLSPKAKPFAPAWTAATEAGSTSATAAPASSHPTLSTDAKPFVPGQATRAWAGGTLSANGAPAAYDPTFSTDAAVADASHGVLGDVDWKAEFDKVMELTERMIEQQLHPELVVAPPIALAAAVATATSTEPTAGPSPAHAAAGAGAGAGAGAAGGSEGTATPPAAPGKTYAAAVAGDAAVAAKGGKGTASSAAPAASSSNNNINNSSSSNAGTKASKATSEVSKRSGMRYLDEADGRSLPPLTANGNRRWRKPTKAEQKRELAQRNAFEAFANALLHSVSPFMAPLRSKCNKALPHLKIDQRFGKSGQPQTAVAQFIAAPLVTNYRPRHFHDVSPGDMEEFMWELSHALEVMPSSYSLIIGYGTVWKRFAVPYLYIACKDYQKEVLALCPDEIPNSRTEPIYEDDIVKDITTVVLAVKELGYLSEMSMMAAMKARAKFKPMFDAFDQIFKPLENYQIVITNLRRKPSQFLLKVSQAEVNLKPQPITLYNDPDLWKELPNVERVVLRTSSSSSPPAASAPVPTASGAKKAARRDMGSDSESAISEDGDGSTDGSSGSGDDEGLGSETDGSRDTRRDRHKGRGGGGGGKGQRRHHPGSGKDGVPMWLVATPVVVSVLCAVATIGLMVSKKPR